MEIPDFFNSYAGRYIVQSFFHALITALIIDRSIQVWGIRSPAVKQRFRFITVMLPVFSFPAYQLINPERSALSFRMDALLDSSRWLDLELWKTVPLGYFFVLLFFITFLIFVFQELIPIIKHTLESGITGPDLKRPEENSAVGKALSALQVEGPDIFIIDDDRLILYSSTNKNPAIFLSSGLINAFTQEELQAALAHEIAHIARSRRPLLIMVFFLRVLMFFNPVVLLEFRRIVQEEEKVCDDFALTLTRKPQALADTLKKLHHSHADPGPAGGKKLSHMLGALEEYSHNSLLESRIARLERGPAQNEESRWTETLITLFVILLINYFIV